MRSNPRFARFPWWRDGWLFCALIALQCIAAGCGKKQPAKGAAEKPATPTRATVTAVTVISNPGAPVIVRSPVAEFDISPSGYIKAYQVRGGRPFSLEVPEAGDAFSDLLTAEGKEVLDFVVNLPVLEPPDHHMNMRDVKILDAKSDLGLVGKHIEVTARSKSRQIEKTLTLEVYDDFSSMAVCSWTYRNLSGAPVHINRIVAQRHRLDASLGNVKAGRHDFWSFDGASFELGGDQVSPISGAFSQRNLMALPVAVKGEPGVLGGGIPVVALWTAAMGMAIGHVEARPVVLALPVRTLPDDRVEVSVELEPNILLARGESYTTPRTFVSVYPGDYYDALSIYSGVLARQGFAAAKITDADYGAAWSSQGYGFDVTPAQMLSSIPILKELGIGWAILDDGWSTDYGGWQPRPDTFPGDSLRKMVQEFHRNNIKVQLAWSPLVVEDGEGREASRKREVAQAVKDHPDWLILDKDGKHARGPRNRALLCPALPEVVHYYSALTARLIRELGFDGNRLDGISTVPRCYNPKHHHKSPDDSIQATGRVFKTILEMTRAIKPDSVTGIDSGGTPPNLAWLAYFDQGVAADPSGSAQVRRRIKMYKALMGSQAAVSGDYVELPEEAARDSNRSIGSHDFASTIGTGGVIGTRFTLPGSGTRSENLYLTAEKKVLWKKWLEIYSQKKLAQGTFLNLYRYGIDVPEGYAIRKGDEMYYAFYSPQPDKPWKGQLELRGLAPRTRYKVLDYENKKELGSVESPVFKLPVEFTGHLLIEVIEKQ
jgi:alpha-galactosidase